MTRSSLHLFATVSLLAMVSAAQAQDGFAIVLGGERIAGDAAVATTIQSVRPPFRSTADVTVVVDGLGVTPRLDLEVAEATETTVTLQSRMNYPAYVTRAEVALLAAGGRVLSTTAIDPNGTVTLRLPEDTEGLTVVHRVYDSVGRFDETAPVAIARVNSARDEPGADRTARRRIPVQGGAVTVRGQGLAPGATVQAFGEVIRPDASGDFVLQRILPAGDRLLPVRVTGGGENIALDPVITIPQSEWFTIATGDLTVGRTLRGENKGDTFTTGRIAGYTRGSTASGWEITASADTGEGALRDLFRDFDRKDPLSVIDRLDPELAYPTYGDDSTITQDAPTDGKLYFRAERDGSYVLWGNYTGELRGGEYLRNERQLYGFQGVYRTPDQTSRGEARASVTAYAAQPDQLPGREVFLGTGGSVYFLQRSDIATASETIMVEVRDPTTGRVIEQRRLVEGRDYRINYLQGVVILAAPLSGNTGGGTITPAPGSRPETRLVVSYEYTPTAADVDGFAYGGRVEGWVTNDLRFGVTAMVEQTDVADQRAYSADLRYVIGNNSFVELEAARTDGPGFGQTFSADGGLVVVTEGAGGGTGGAYRFKAEVDFADLGWATKGTLTAYAEQREAGFTTLDHRITDDERLVGFAVAAEASERLSYKFAVDDFESDAGRALTEGLAEVSYKASDRVTLDFGLALEDRAEPGDADKTGSRTDAALKVTFTQSDALEYYVFGQSTLARSGGLDRNDRIGAGVKLGFAQGWTFEGEVSDGSFGAGGRALVSYEREGANAYFGYTLDPGRELDGVTLNGRDEGQFVLGGRRTVNDAVTVFGENTYDMFGRRTSLTSTYGVDYKVNALLALSASAELGRVTDSVDGDFDRTGLSFGAAYDDDAGLTAKARLELRRDRGVQSGSSRDADTLLFTGNFAYEVSPERRWIGTVDLADTDAETSSTLSGEYARVTLGYAYRPINDDRLNVLARYTYLYDMYGQRVDGTDDPGPRQRSHVFSVDATYDVNARWTLGGKLGFRLGETSPDDATPLQQNDAALAVLNARYHLTFQWDLLVEGRYLTARQAGLDEVGVLATAYRQFGENFSVGVGYNFGSFSDDLTDLTTDDEGIFLNVIAQF
ncbi:MAG: hypothetical protein RLZZ437_1107 [Pseudomonadota bacterium]|jgi:hypothetical protein